MREAEDKQRRRSWLTRAWTWFNNQQLLVQLAVGLLVAVILGGPTVVIVRSGESGTKTTPTTQRSLPVSETSSTETPSSFTAQQLATVTFSVGELQNALSGESIQFGPNMDGQSRATAGGLGSLRLCDHVLSSLGLGPESGNNFMVLPQGGISLNFYGSDVGAFDTSEHAHEYLRSVTSEASRCAFRTIDGSKLGDETFRFSKPGTVEASPGNIDQYFVRSGAVVIQVAVWSTDPDHETVADQLADDCAKRAAAI